MRKHVLIGLAAFLSTQAIFAADAQDTTLSPDAKPCAVVAQSCLNAGFVRDGAPGKRFWEDCMKPLLMGQTIQGITIDANVAVTCRTNKINQLKQELQDLQSVSTSSNSQ